MDTFEAEFSLLLNSDGSQRTYWKKDRTKEKVRNLRSSEIFQQKNSSYQSEREIVYSCA